MPSRIIYDKCRKSHTLDALSPDAERMFYRLLTVADDYGRFDADPRVMLSECFPLRVEHIPAKKVEQWRNEMTRTKGEDKKPLIRLYKKDEHVYGEFVQWFEYQRDRRKERNPPRSKFPRPEDGEEVWPLGKPAMDTPPDVITTYVRRGIPDSFIGPVQPPAVLAAAADARFNAFWGYYPARNGKKLLKGEARTRFLELPVVEQEQCILAAKAYARHCKESERTPRDAPRFFYGQTGEVWRDFIPSEPEPPVRRPMAPASTALPPPPPTGVDCPEELRDRFGFLRHIT